MNIYVYEIPQTICIIFIYSFYLFLYRVTASSLHGSLGVTAINKDLNVGQGFGVEVILTFVLVFVIVATTDSNRSDAGMASIAIGLTIALLHLAGVSEL